MNKAEYKIIKKELAIIVRGVEGYTNDIKTALKNESVESLYDTITSKINEMRELREYVKDYTLDTIKKLVKNERI